MIAARMTAKLRGFAEQVRAEHKRRGTAVDRARVAMVARHREERTVLERQQDGRWIDETNARAARLPKGLGGLWSRITGRYAKIRRQNEYEAWQSYMRDQAEKDALIARQLEERQRLQLDIDRVQEAQAKELQRLNQDIGRYVSMTEQQPSETDEHFRDTSRHPAAGLGRDAGRDSGFEPEL